MSDTVPSPAPASSAPPLWRDAHAWVLLALAILLAGGFFSMTWQTGDDARYMGLAQSLLDGKGFTKAYLPDGEPETITPPAQPLLMAAAMKVFGRGVVPGKVTSSALFVLGTLAIYAWARRRLGDPWLAAGVTVMGQFTMAVLSMSCWYMVEMNYMAASFIVLALAGRDDVERRPGLVLAIGMLAGYVYLVRATGLAFAAAGGLFFLGRRSWRSLALFVAGFLLLAGPWMVRTYLVTGATEAYLPLQTSMAGADQAASYPWQRIPRDIAKAFPVYYAQALPDALFYRLTGEFGLMRKVGLSALEPAVRWLVLGLVTGGFLLRLRRPRLADLYWVFYWLIITAPPFPPQGHWYVYPMLPLAAAYLMDAVLGLGGLLGRVAPRLAAQRAARWAVAALAMYTLATAVTGAAVHFGKERRRWGMAPWAAERYATYDNDYMDAWGRFVEAGLWASSNSPPGTLLVSRQPNHLYLITGCKGWRYDLPEVPGADLFERMEHYATNRPVVLVEDAFVSYPGASFSYGVGHWALRDLFAAHGDRLELVHECGPPATRVWRFKPAQPN